MDKVLHFVAGASIAMIFIVGSFSITTTYDYPVNNEVIVGAGAATGVIGGILKEVWDSTGHGTVEAADVIATAIGAVSISTLFLLLLP